MFEFKVIVSIILAIGIFFPYTSWQIFEGWKYKDAEPSEVYLTLGRIMSVIGLIIIWIRF